YARSDVAAERNREAGKREVLGAEAPGDRAVEGQRSGAGIDGQVVGDRHRAVEVDTARGGRDVAVQRGRTGVILQAAGRDRVERDAARDDRDRADVGAD